MQTEDERVCTKESNGQLSHHNLTITFLAGCMRLRLNKYYAISHLTIEQCANGSVCMVLRICKIMDTIYDEIIKVYCICQI